MRTDLGALAALLLAIGSATLPAAAETAPTTDLKVLTFNVWHGLRSGESKKRFPGEESERAERRFALQVEEIRRLDPDLLLLQEVNPNQRRARRYADALGYDEIHKTTSCGLHLGVFYKIPRNVNEGLAILARRGLDLRRVASKRLSGNAWCSASWGFQTKESRYVLIGEIAVADRRILVATTHLSSPPFVPAGFEQELDRLTGRQLLLAEQRAEILGELAAGRARNLDETRRLMAEISRHRRRLDPTRELPVILGGDFNNEPGSASVALLETSDFRNVAAGPRLLTWNPVVNRVNYAIGTKRADPLPTFGIGEIKALLDQRAQQARQIDFLFMSGELGPATSEMVLARERDGIYPSDHFGILATIELR